jgi:hypothetical protein
VVGAPVGNPRAVFFATAAFLFGWFWNLLPQTVRRWIKPGYEFLAFVPVLLVVGYAAWHLGPVLERWLFVVTNPATGERVADFRLWWPTVTGLSL